MAESLSDMGEVLCKLEEYEEALDMLQRAWAMRWRVYGAAHYETLRSLSMIGEVHLRSGRLQEAKAILHEALTGQESADTNPQPISDTLLLLGETLLALNAMPRAYDYLTRAVAIRREAFGNDRHMLSDSDTLEIHGVEGK